MIKGFRGLKYILRVMTRLPSCCLLTSTLTLLFVSMVTIDFVYGDEGYKSICDEEIIKLDTGQTTATTTTTKEPFLESTMFIGLAAGIGGFIGFAVLCCIFWKCCCGSKD